MTPDAASASSFVTSTWRVIVGQLGHFWADVSSKHSRTTSALCLVYSTNQWRRAHYNIYCHPCQYGIAATSRGGKMLHADCHICKLCIDQSWVHQILIISCENFEFSCLDSHFTRKHLVILSSMDTNIIACDQIFQAFPLQCLQTASDPKLEAKRLAKGYLYMSSITSISIHTRMFAI